jgi:hypothetical protein
MISSISSSHASNAQQVSQSSSPKAAAEPKTQPKSTLPQDTVNLKSASGSDGDQDGK